MRRGIVASNIATVFDAKKVRYIDTADNGKKRCLWPYLDTLTSAYVSHLALAIFTQAINMFIVARLRVCCARLAFFNPLELLTITAAEKVR